MFKKLWPRAGIKIGLVFNGSYSNSEYMFNIKNCMLYSTFNMKKNKQLHIKQKVESNFMSVPNNICFVNNKIHQRNISWKSIKNDFGKYEKITKLGESTKELSVPDYINCPSYYFTGEPIESPIEPEIKVTEEIEKMKKSCYLARLTMNEVVKKIEMGMTTEDVDVLAHEAAVDFDSFPSTLKYKSFPKSCCTSVNNIACHGIPDNRILQDGDILSVDITVYHDGYHGDCCDTLLLGNVDEKGKKLVDAARKCRDKAIAICGPDVYFSAIGAEVERVAKEEGVTVVPTFAGHGIGKYFHGPPDIYHCYNNYGGVMMPGMTFTVEPVVAQGSNKIRILEDDWTVVMQDGGRAAQFEHTILITYGGHEILTKYI